MALAHLQAVAEAVKETLNAAAKADQFALHFAGERSFNPSHDMEKGDVDDLTMDVVGRKSRSIPMTRGGRLQVDYDVDVCLWKKLDKAIEQGELDTLNSVAQQVHDYFFTHAVTGRKEQLIEATTDANSEFDCDLPKVREAGLFKSIIILTFRGFR